MLGEVMLDCLFKGSSGSYFTWVLLEVYARAGRSLGLRDRIATRHSEMPSFSVPQRGQAQ